LPRTIISELDTPRRIFLKETLAKSLGPDHVKYDRSVGHHLIEHIQFQFSACKRKKIGL
jgi:hypothetical protein